MHVTEKLYHQYDLFLYRFSHLEDLVCLCSNINIIDFCLVIMAHDSFFFLSWFCICLALKSKFQPQAMFFAFSLANHKIWTIVFFKKAPSFLSNDMYFFNEQVSKEWLMKLKKQWKRLKHLRRSFMFYFVIDYYTKLQKYLYWCVCFLSSLISRLYSCSGSNDLICSISASCQARASVGFI